MSCSLAALLIFSSRCSESRKEIVSVEGLRLEKATRLAWDQSRYSDESCFDQKSRSWSSVVNLGIFFIVFILFSFLRACITSRNHSYKTFSFGKRQKQHAPLACFPERIVPLFSARVLDVGHNKRLVEKDFLTFANRYFMSNPVLFSIAFVPLKPSKMRKVRHTDRYSSCICSLYTTKLACQETCKNRRRISLFCSKLSKSTHSPSACMLPPIAPNTRQGTPT